MSEPNTEPSLMILDGGGHRRRDRVVEFTVKEFAHRERVDERTVRRWIEKEAVKVRRTPGGGIRIIGASI